MFMKWCGRGFIFWGMMRSIGTQSNGTLSGNLSKGRYRCTKAQHGDDRNPVEPGTDCMITNPSVVAAVADYVALALQGEGRIVIGDAPVQECDFDKLIQENGYLDLLQFYQEHLPDSITIELVDFRQLRTKAVNGVYHSEQTNQEGVLVLLQRAKRVF